MQFTCYQCSSPWEDYQRFKKHCKEVHGYEYESESPPAYQWNFSDPDSKYQRDLRTVREMIDRVAAKRKAELAVGQNEMEPKIKSLKTTHGELLSNVNNNDNLSDDQVNNNPVQISPAEGIQDAGGGDPEKTCH